MNFSIFQPIRDWFATLVDNHTSSDSEADRTQSLSEHTPVELPTALEVELSHAIQRLPPHPALYKSIETQLTSSLQALNRHPEAPNSLVVLGNPSDVLSLTVHHSLECWLRQFGHLHREIKQEKIKQEEIEPELNGDRPSVQTPLISLCGHWNHRPSNTRDMVSQIRSELENLDSNLQRSESSSLPIVFLPLLEWCFLRCVDGFEGIEVLTDYVLGDRSRFWVIGCNSWAWTYLDYVCQISTYFEQTMMLPPLGRYELKEWLSPIAEKVDLVMDANEDDRAKQLQLQLDDDGNEPDNWISSREKRFYEKLANDSRGLSTIAADFWLRSLSVAKDDEQTGALDNTDSPSTKSSETYPSTIHSSQKDASSGASDEVSSSNRSEQTGSEQPPSVPHWPRLTQQNVSAPKLFSLSVGDRHILYSILLHGQISIPHLAQSLGDDESIVRAKVQLLLRAGILNRHSDQIQVDPAYYLSIRSDLERNNFLVGDISS